MSARPRIAVACAPECGLLELGDMARTIEALGFDELWFTEEASAAATAAAAESALATTRRIRVGFDLVASPEVGPGGLARMIAPLAAHHSNRICVAIGAGEDGKPHMGPGASVEAVATGASCVVLAPVPSSGFEQLERFAEEVLPLVVAHTLR